MGLLNKSKSQVKSTEKTSKHRKVKGSGKTGTGNSSFEYEAVSVKDSAESQGTSFPPKFALYLSIAALVLCFVPTVSLSGSVLGIDALLLLGYAAKNRTKIESTQATKGLAIASIVFGVLMTFVSLSAFSAQNQVADDLTLANTGAEQPIIQTVEEPHLSIMVGKTNDIPASCLAINVTGSTKTGFSVNDVRTIRPGQAYELDYPAGAYDFSYTEFTSSNGEEVYKSNSVSCTYDGENDKTVELALLLDQEKTQQLKDAKEAEKAAAEEQAAAQKFAEEQAAAAQAGEATKAQSQAQAPAASSSGAQSRSYDTSSSSDDGGRTVYIAASGKGECYHSYETCSGMKGANAVTVSQAKAMGKRPCKNCM